jgi:hypothetical protein
MEVGHATHDEFLESVLKHLRERENCPILIIVQAPHGLEMHTNFASFPLQFGLLDIAKMTASMHFERETRRTFESGENTAIEKDIVKTMKTGKGTVN